MCLVFIFLAISSATASVDAFSSLYECQVDHAQLVAQVAQLEAQIAGIRNVTIADPSIQIFPKESEQLGRQAIIKSSILAFLCVVLAAVAAGLTMGLASLEPIEMEIIVKSEEKDMTAEKDKQKLQADQEAATNVLPLIKDYHWLLVTLLLMNAIATEALPLILQQFLPFWLVVVLSVSLVLMFGEIIPSAMFTGSEQLRVAAKFVPFVFLCRFVLAPVAWPLAMVLNCLLGEDHKGRYNFAELRAIVGIHARLLSEQHLPVAFKNHDNRGLGIVTTEMPHNFGEDAVVSFMGESTKLRNDGTKYYVKPCAPLTGRNNTSTFQLYPSEGRHAGDVITFAAGDLTWGHFTLEERDELKIMHGVMNLTHMTAEAAMVPLSTAWMLEAGQRLSGQLMEQILHSGYSRIPVYAGYKHNVRGFLLVKKLIVANGKGRDVQSVGVDSLVVVPLAIPMLDLLNKFQESRCHLALVTDSPATVRQAWESGAEVPHDVHMAGIITMEDVIERLLQEEIEDEQDAEKMLRLQSSSTSGHETRRSSGRCTPQCLGSYTPRSSGRCTPRSSEDLHSSSSFITGEVTSLQEPLLPRMFMEV